MTALLALGLAGCPGVEEPCFGGFPAQPPGQQLVGVGQEVSLVVTADLSRACMEGGTARKPESVTVQVYDSQNQPVPATADLPVGGSAATIRFTPTVTGRHHIVVAFAPVGSLHQFGVQALTDRSSERPLAQLPSQPHCTYLDRTTSGTWLCGTTALRAPDATPQALTANSTHLTVVAGDVVWVMESDRVLRYVDRGAGPLELTGTAPLPSGISTGGGFAPGPHSRLATGEDLLLLTGASLLRFTVTGAGGLTSSPVTPWTSSAVPPPFGGDSIPGLLVRAAERVLVVSRTLDPRTGVTGTQACPFRPGVTGAYVPMSAEACHTLEGDPVGYEDGVVWTRSVNTSTVPATAMLRRYTALNGRLVEQGELPLEGQLSVSNYLLRPGPTVPFLVASGQGGIGTYAVPLWNPEKGLLELELLPRAPPNTLTPRTGQHFIWEDMSGTSSGVRIFARQSTR
ncbi:hypothetical protein [Pyxidicoccus xibeiensis]|uniref:hypothetical protein n=1 Tax=Pyxidicoccus xibeiensis TaxID=2906759 RepID=UPI0020A835ED|nr:hypothetical protein [Pyxidicoccus xibeiensis]MCP3139664.1 hypothetical protein [Pyxidicoccus xibeiensis]